MTRLIRDPGRRPTHPGELLRLDVLPGLEITQDEFAQRLGVSRLTVSQLLHEHRALSASMAVRLERALGTSAEHWLAMQQAVDLWEARRESHVVVDQSHFTGASAEAANAVERARTTSRATYLKVVGVQSVDTLARDGSAWTRGVVV